MSQFHRLTALVCFCFATLKATSWEQNSGHCQTSVLPDFIQITRTQFAWQPLDPTSISFGTHVLVAILSLPAKIHLSVAPMQLRWFQEWRSEMRKASRRQRHTSSTIPLIPLKKIGATTRPLLKWSFFLDPQEYTPFLEMGCGCLASSCHRPLEMWLLSHEVQHLYIRLFWYLLGTVQARLYCSADRPDARSGVHHERVGNDGKWIIGARMHQLLGIKSRLHHSLASVPGVMCSYDAENGHPSCANDFILNQQLRSWKPVAKLQIRNP